MGTGFLLFGYFFFADLTLGIPDTDLRFDMLPDVFGWVLLFIGCTIAARFSKKLVTAKYVALVMILPALFSFLNGLGKWELFFADAFYRSIYPFFSVLLTVVFHYYLLFGLKEIADEVGDQKVLASRLHRGFYLTLFCFFWILLARAVLLFAPQLQGYCALISSFSTMVYLIANGFSIYQFFKNITVD